MGIEHLYRMPQCEFSAVVEVNKLSRSDLVRLAGPQHVFPLDDLDPLPALWFAEGALVRVEAVPALPGGERDALALQERGDSVELRLRGRSEVRAVVEQAGNGLVGVALVWPMRPTGPRLIQPVT